MVGEERYPGGGVVRGRRRWRRVSPVRTSVRIVVSCEEGAGEGVELSVDLMIGTQT